MDVPAEPQHIITNPPLIETNRVLGSFFLNLGSTLTAREYQRTAREFFTLLQVEVNGPAELRRHHIIAYRRWLEGRGLANKTIQKKLSAIASLCKFLAEAGLVERDITFGVQRPRTENRRETADFSDENVRKILVALNPKSYSPALHRAVLAVGFFTGLRSAEIRGLRLKNLGMVNGIRVLNLQIKGGRRHEIPLHPFVISAIDQHIETMRRRGFKLDDPEHVLLPSRGNNQPLMAEALSYILKSAMERAGIRQDDFRRHSPHSMRASFAGHLLNTVEARLEDVQAAMGHANPATTQRYNKRKKGHERSPVFRIEF
ncbi:MAG TPA: tyrosine-type recombinase/integrase [Oligoflexus sp.]|uniref:tyrosine-type recombinase/integrase n=1 Tax=Oligoflexus sp. TaxID=1971216 RepID=UPI002D691752|nr:tyrosine-type recombinase/integrase [Oligoflexus sp.]HYX38327.1 tyrosine-type recombinase/integrase [Oligoflexus sp.]